MLGAAGAEETRVEIGPAARSGTATATAAACHPGWLRNKAFIYSLFAWSKTIVNFQPEQYFSLTPNQPAVNNPRSFTACRAG